jgi:hypothetical protein
VAGLAALGLDYNVLKARITAINLSWEKVPYATYTLTNLGARIRGDKERLVAIKARATRTAAADATPNGVLIETTGEWTRVTFAEKPERAILTALRDAHFSWGNGYWSGRTDKLPTAVTAMALEGDGK